MMVKNKILLLNLPPALESRHSNQGSTYPSTALMLIGTMLRRSGYETVLLDGAYDEDYLSKLREYVARNREELLYIGMSVMTTQAPFVLEASRAIKELTDGVPVVCGGPHPTLFPEETLSGEAVDIIAINEGAVTAVKLAECLKDSGDLSQVRGIGYKDHRNGKAIVINPPAEPEDIRELPYFDFSLLNIEPYLSAAGVSVYQREFGGYKEKVRIMPILTGLGCPYKCQFCINVILKRRYRFRPAAAMVAEIKHLQEKYQANTFLFLDEDFFISKKRLREFLDLVEQEDLHFNWRMWCRVDHFRDDFINQEVIRRLGRIGYGSMVMGGESGNQEILDALRKGTTTGQIVNSLRLLAGSKIFARYSFMVGLENENLEQIKHTLEFCLELKKVHPQVDIAVFIFRLYPGSPIYNRLVATYDLQRPGSLQAWAVYLERAASYTEMPWAPRYFREKSGVINFYATHAFTALPGPRAGLKQSLRAWMQRLAQLRLKWFFLNFPVEFWFYKIYHRALGTGVMR